MKNRYFIRKILKNSYLLYILRNDIFYFQDIDERFLTSEYHIFSKNPELLFLLEFSHVIEIIGFEPENLYNLNMSSQLIYDIDNEQVIITKDDESRAIPLVSYKLLK